MRAPIHWHWQFHGRIGADRDIGDVRRTGHVCKTCSCLWNVMAIPAPRISPRNTQVDST